MPMPVATVSENQNVGRAYTEVRTPDQRSRSALKMNASAKKLPCDDAFKFRLARLQKRATSLTKFKLRVHELGHQALQRIREVLGLHPQSTWPATFDSCGQTCSQMSMNLDIPAVELLLVD